MLTLGTTRSADKIKKHLLIWMTAEYISTETTYKFAFRKVFSEYFWKMKFLIISILHIFSVNDLMKDYFANQKNSGDFIKRDETWDPDEVHRYLEYFFSLLIDHDPSPPTLIIL